MVTRKEIDTFLRANYRKIPGVEYMFGGDNNQDTVAKFEAAPLRVLCVFLSTGTVRSVSNTFNALSSLIHHGSDNQAFVDYSYVPELEAQEMLKKNGIPYIFGNISHAPVTDYDIVFLSHAIVPEILNLPHMLFNSGIPINMEDRLKDNSLPLLVYGGAAAVCSFSVFGDTGMGGHSLVDVAQYGYGEGQIESFIGYALKYKNAGNDIKDKSVFIEALKTDYDRADYLFHPLAYKFITDPNEPLKVVRIEKVDPRVPDKVKFNRIDNGVWPGFDNKVFNLTGENADSHDVHISLGCSSYSSCSFCVEGLTTGAYREKKFEDVQKAIQDIKRNCAPNSLSAYSFNLNYYYRFLDLLREMAINSSHISLINERMDVIASSPEYMRLAKALGLIRVSSPIEGISERIRNRYFNKNLSREQILKAFENIFAIKPIMVKVGLIHSGRETKEDYDEWFNLCYDVAKLRDEMGCNTAFQFSVTPLVHYNQTPLGWDERITARKSYEDIRDQKYFIEGTKVAFNCTREELDNFMATHDVTARKGGEPDDEERYEVERKIPVRIKYNGRGPGTYLEQLLLDLDVGGTKFITDVTLNKGMNYQRHFGYKEKDLMVAALKDQNIDPEWIFHERNPEDPRACDLVEFTTPKNYEKWKEGFYTKDYERKMCMLTPANPKAACVNCGMCPTAESKRHTCARKIWNEHTFDDVINSLDEERHVDTTTIVFKKGADYDMWSMEYLKHYITAQFLQRSDSLSDAFYAVGPCSTNWTSDNGQKAWFSGNHVFQVYWKRRVSKAELQEFVDEINQNLTVGKITNIIDGQKENKLQVSSVISYLGVIDSLTMSQVKDKLANYEWDVKVAVKSMGGALEFETHHMPELKEKFLVVPSKNKLLIYVTVPAKVNPYLLMNSIFGKSMQYWIENSRWQIVDHGKVAQANCSCGKELIYSYVSDSVSPICPTCKGKRLLYTLTK